MEYYQKELVAIDIETSGLLPGRDEIIELAAVRLREGVPVEEFQSLVKPEGEIPRIITRLTGLKAQDFREAPAIEEALPRFLDFISSSTLLAHNASFDLGFIQTRLGVKLKNPALDTLELSRLACPQAGSYRLAYITRYLGLTADRHHRALDDARLTALLFIKLDEQMKKWNPALINGIIQIGRTFNWSLIDYFTYLETYQTRRFFSLGLPTPNRFSTDSKTTELFTASQPVRDDRWLGPSDIPIPVLEELLSPEGAYASSFSEFEFRPQQLCMLRKVAESFNQDRHLLVEAGTGSGKSLAYLLPALVWAMASRQRVVVSTHTLTLQQQLLEQDLPRLRQVFNSLAEDEEHPLHSIIPKEKLADLKIALAKGRNNYVCLRKWYSLQPEKNSFEPEQKNFFIRMLSWLHHTDTGDCRELNLNDNQPWWHLVASDYESCWGRKCPHFHDQCFFMRSRRQCEEADLLVANHALLLSDLNAESKVLPSYERLIIDEAHHLEDLASEYLGIQVGEASINGFFRQLYHQGYSGQSGILINLRQDIDRRFWDNAHGLPLDGEKLLTPIIDKLKEAQRFHDNFFGSLKSFINLHQAADNGYSRQYLRLLPKMWEDKEWDEVKLYYEKMAAGFRHLITGLEQIDRTLGEWERENEPWAGSRQDLAAKISVGKKMASDLEKIFSLGNSSWVYWAEVEERGGGQQAFLKAAPVEVEEQLNSLLYATKKTVILTSATITVENSFKYYMERVGLNHLDDRLSVLQLDSPFAFEKQALLCVPRGLPDPSRVRDEDYAAAISPVLTDLIRTVQGRTLVLFTSNQLLRQTYFQIKNVLENEDILVLGHNIDGGQSRLLEEFRETPRSVILGSSSLWEGVDIPGEALSCVVIAKLPFGTPNLPIAEARIESLQSRNRNGFYGYTMPQAVLRLKQGFGRLIRTQQDKGVVVIMDNRIIDRSYGRRFLRSLPVSRHLRGEFPAIRSRIADWLDERIG